MQMWNAPLVEVLPFLTREVTFVTFCLHPFHMKPLSEEGFTLKGRTYNLLQHVASSFILNLTYFQTGVGMGAT